MMPPETPPAPAIALVTGAGRGLGRALALELAARGLRVAAMGRTGADLETLAQQEGQGRIYPVVADVADAQALRAGFEAIDRDLGPVDTVINNAAVYPHRDFLEETPESFQQTLAINLGGMVAVSQLSLARMVEAGQGRIVNVTSYADRRPVQLSSAYSVSKGAGRILTRAMVADLGDRFPDIVINDWIPGALNTAMGIPEGHEVAEAAKWGAGLALWRARDLNGVVFVENREELPALSFKRRLFNKLTGQSPAPRVIAAG